MGTCHNSGEMLVDTAVEAHNEIEAIVGGYHGDAFRILGPHALVDAKDGSERWIIRAFLPHATAAEVLLSGVALPMERRHAHGFFVAHSEVEPRDYRLRLRLWNGETQIIDDPYRFPPLLTDFDLYLHSEGTNYES